MRRLRRRQRRRRRRKGRPKDAGALPDKALEVAAGQPIYVCAASDAAVAGATLAGAQEIYGGLACGTWTYSAEHSAVLGPADLPALHVSTDVTVRLEDHRGAPGRLQPHRGRQPGQAASDHRDVEPIVLNDSSEHVFNV